MAHKILNRRLFLKSIISAGGAITAAAFLPSKWIKPMVEIGVLPAHAQTSFCTNMIGDPARGYGVDGRFQFYWWPRKANEISHPSGIPTPLTFTVTGTGGVTITGPASGQAKYFDGYIAIGPFDSTGVFETTFTRKGYGEIVFTFKAPDSRCWVLNADVNQFGDIP